MSDIIKSDVWDLYDPNWEQRFDEHFEAYKKLADIPNLSEEQIQQRNLHEQGWKDAHVAQFKNAQEYADSMIVWVERNAKNYNVPWVKIDTSKLKTREDANKAYNEAAEQLEHQKALKLYSLPVDHTSGLFNKERTKSSYAFFPGYHGSTTETLITMEQTDEALNVCFTHFRDNPGTSVVNNIEGIATNAYATELYKTGLKPQQINWFIHIPATKGIRESFMKADMVFNTTGYRNPNFTHFQAVPEAIKMAQYNAEQEKISSAPNQLGGGTKPKGYLPL